MEENKKMLTQEEIDFEIGKIEQFFNQVTKEIKAWTAERLIREIVNWACLNHYEALGIFQEAMSSFRERSLQVMAEEAEEEQRSVGYENALENQKEYMCIKSIEEYNIYAGEKYYIGFACDDENYGGGKKYLIFNEDEYWVDICQDVLDEHFKLCE